MNGSSFLDALDVTSPFQADVSLTSTILAIMLSFLLGQAVAWTYLWTHNGLSYSRTFTQSLVLMSIIVTILMLVIGNSIVTAFGLLGALALIRFRNVLKDTRDTVFVFMSLVVGMAVGTQRFITAIIGTAAMILLTFYLEMIGFGSHNRFDGYLTLRLSTAGSARTDSERLLERFCRSFKQVSTRQAGGEDDAEYVYRIGLRRKDSSPELLQELRKQGGVAYASLLLRSELSEV